MIVALIWLVPDRRIERVVATTETAVNKGLLTRLIDWARGNAVLEGAGRCALLCRRDRDQHG